MKLFEALAALQKVTLDEVQDELKEAEKNLETTKREARKVFQAAVKGATDRVKLLRRLKMSKEKAGKPLPKKKMKRGG